MSEIRLVKLSKQHRKDGELVRAVDEVDLTIRDGEFLVLLGPSGCGKTSILRCIAGLDEPTSGAIEIAGQAVCDTGLGLSLPPDRRNIGMVFQSYALWPHMTVAANVGYPLRARTQLGRTQIQEAVEGALAQVGLTGYGARYPSDLSGGQQQRVALARASVSKPRLLLFDEPLSNLDAQLRIRLRNDLRRLHQETRHTAVYVTHDQAEALALADRIAVMREGRIEQLGTPADIFLAPISRYVAEFVGFENFADAEVVSIDPQGVRVRPHGWAGPDLRARAPSEALIPGQKIGLAIRSSNVTVLSGGTSPPPQEQNVLAARLTDVTYVGDRYLGTLEMGALKWTGTLTLLPGDQSTERVGGSCGQAVTVMFPSHALLVLPIRSQPRPLSSQCQ